MELLIVGDIEKAEYLKSLLNLDLTDYNFLILTGDLSGTPDGWKIGKARGLNDLSFIPKDKDPKKYYHELLEPSVEKLREIDNILLKIKKHLKIFAVYGNTDFKSIIARVQPKGFQLLHKRAIKMDGLNLIGYNGHPMYPWEIEEPLKKDIFGYTYSETANELNSFREEDIYHDLIELTKKYTSTEVITVTHTPPFGILDKVKQEMIEWAKLSYGKKAENGNVGSSGLKDFIVEFNPLMSIFGHIHEAKGIKMINGITYINAGKFDERKEYVHVKIKNNIVSCQFESI